MVYTKFHCLMLMLKYARKSGTNMEFKEETLSKEYVFRGKVIQVRCDKAKRADGLEVYREVVEHIGGVSVALENEEGKFCLVRQWRYAQEAVLLEFPAGKKEVGEDELTTAKREIQEETGYTGKDFYDLGYIVPTGAYDSEKIYMYYAKSDAYVGTHFDEDEYVEVAYYTLKELKEMILRNEIVDAKTIAMVFKIDALKSCGTL